MRGLVAIIILFSLSACKKQKLDALGFPGVQLDQYEFQDYADPELEVPDSILNANYQQTLVSFESIDSKTGESFTIYGLYMGDTATIDTDTIIYFCHGQARHNDFYWTRQALWANLGGFQNYGVFTIDYRGYGMSEGTSSEHGLIDDANAGLDWLISNGADQLKTYYYGFSLGAIPLIELAGKRADFVPQKLICESPLASVEYLTQTSSGINVDADFLTELDFNNAENIKDVQIPYFWIHGVEDDYVKIENGEIIYGNYSGSFGQALRVPEARHANVPEVYGHNQYMQDVLDFIRM
jgi:alpha/beta superfamily hydrolase